MEKTTSRRRSHCIKCGKRLSTVTATGDIRWQPSQVDDQGLMCLPCYEAQHTHKPKKGNRTSK